MPAALALFAALLLLPDAAFAADRAAAAPPPPRGSASARDLDVTMSVVPAGASVTEAIGRRIEIGGSRPAEQRRDGGDRGSKNREREHGDHGDSRGAAEDLHEQIRGDSAEGNRQEVEQGDAGRKSSDGGD